jgi:hypothetical protein
MGLCKCCWGQQQLAGSKYCQDCKAIPNKTTCAGCYEMGSKDWFNQCLMCNIYICERCVGKECCDFDSERELCGPCWDSLLDAI